MRVVTEEALQRLLAVLHPRRASAGALAPAEVPALLGTRVSTGAVVSTVCTLVLVRRVHGLVSLQISSAAVAKSANCTFNASAISSM